MCDSATSDKIREACSDLVGKNMMFTAFDVTKKVWELLGNTPGSRWPKGYHSSIKNDTHNEMRSHVDNGTYEKCQWNVGAPVSATLYFPVGSEKLILLYTQNGMFPIIGPNNYVPGTANVVTPTVVTTSDDDDTDDDDADDDNDDGYDSQAASTKQQLADSGKVKPDVHGQLHVPCDFLRKAGFSPSDVAYAIQKGDKLSLVKHASTPPIASYHVDYHGAVRLSRRTITTVWPAGLSFTFDATSDEVLVSQG